RLPLPLLHPCGVRRFRPHRVPGRGAGDRSRSGKARGAPDRGRAVSAPEPPDSEDTGDTEDAGPESAESPEPAWRDRLLELAAFARRRITGDYVIDDFGYDRDFTESILLPPLRMLAEKWFRVETIGMDNVPVDSGALLVANHSGTVAIDGVMAA